MNISFSWLKDYLKIDQTAEELAERLTRSGLEVKSIVSHGASMKNVIAAQILESIQHPNADRLSVCKVDDGSGTLRQIVCGAKNYKVGDKILLALPGAILPGGLKIKIGKLRGVESEGMMCSSKELGLGEGVEGLHILPSETVPGTELSALFPSDDVLELEITPNRPDWLGYVGVAREASVFGAGEFFWKAPMLPPFLKDTERITIQATEACSFYSLRLLEQITVTSSPAWLVRRFESIGARSINNIVDLANYVMFETGQPLHAFDADKIKGSLVVRFAKPGETLTALDGCTHHLRATDLVIADDQGPQALAGIIGGLSSSVTETTTSLLLESAVFNSSVVRQSARHHGISTDAAYRFERGSHAVTAVEASARATSLMLEMTSGTASKELFTTGVVPEPTTITFRKDRCAALLGTTIGEEIIVSYFKKLGLQSLGEDRWHIPPWRLDLVREVDLMEEVARLHGMENIASRSLIFPSASTSADHLFDLAMKVRKDLVAAGFYEARTSALVAQEEVSEQAIALRNPMGEQQSVLRTTLLAKLKNVLQCNARQGAAALRFFEIGTIFQKPMHADALEESLSLAMIMTGVATPMTWRSEKDRSLDVYDLKGVIDSLAPGKIKYHSWQREKKSDLALMLEVFYEEKPCGYIGLMTPAAARKLISTGQEHPIVLAELQFSFFQKMLGRDLWKKEKLASQFPAVTRDLALILERSQDYGAVEKIVLESKEPFLKKIIPFDVFLDPSGIKIAPEKKSLAVSLLFQSDEKTLTAEEVQTACDRLVKGLQEKLVCEVRS